MSEWGPWIDGTVPPPVGSYVQMDCVDLKGRGDLLHECVVLGFHGDKVKISPELPFRRQWQLDRYRIRKPRGLTILEDLIADIPAPAAPRVPA
jgi:hypothetical protein